MALEPERVIRALAGTFERWRAPNSPERARLAAEHGVYSAPVVERGVKLALQGWTAEALAALRARELSEPCWVPPVTAVWLAGSIPTAAFASLALPLLAGSAVYAKPASADPVSARLFAASLRESDPAVGAALAIGGDAKALDEADAVVAHGSDATITAIRARVGPNRPFLGYGHKLSVAAVGPAVDPLVAARRLALDVALWDGRGCLSPSWVLAVDAPRGRAAEVARAFAAALEEIEEDLPRGALDAAEAAELLDLRARAAVREGTRLEMAAGASTWTVALETGEVRPPPGSSASSRSCRCRTSRRSARSSRRSRHSSPAWATRASARSARASRSWRPPPARRGCVRSGACSFRRSAGTTTASRRCARWCAGSIKESGDA